VANIVSIEIFVGKTTMICKNIPNTCNKCFFNYDGITCRLYAKQIWDKDEDQDAGFDYNRKPSFCNAAKLVVYEEIDCK